MLYRLIFLLSLMNVILALYQVNQAHQYRQLSKKVAKNQEAQKMLKEFQRQWIAEFEMIKNKQQAQWITQNRLGLIAAEEEGRTVVVSADWYKNAKK